MKCDKFNRNMSYPLTIDESDIDYKNHEMLIIMIYLPLLCLW